MTVPLINFEVCQAEAIGVDTSTTSGVTFTTSGSANTKSSYAQIIASTAVDISWLILSVRQSSSSSSFHAMAFDIAIGGSGSEVDVIKNVVFSWPAGDPGNGTIALPIQIPAGTRVSYRVQDSSPGSTFVLALYGFTGNFGHISSYESIGFDAANTRGTETNLSGTANVAGSWVQLSASTGKDYAGLFVVVDTQDINTSARFLIEIGIGGSGSEVAILSFLASINNGMSASWFGFVPIVIKAGTRIAVRATAHDTTLFAKPRVTFYGAVG